MTEHDAELASLPAPPIDPAFAARVQRRGRIAMADRGLLPGEIAVPILLILAGVFYTAVSVDAIVRIFVG